MQLSEQTKIEAQIGFTSGILVGAISASILVLFFTPWEWYFKLFSAVGSIGIIGSLVLSLTEQIKTRRNYLDMKLEMERVKKESESKLAELKGGNDVKQEENV